jgi:tetratricopeptide (TPR) repeat protein
VTPHVQEVAQIPAEGNLGKTSFLHLYYLTGAGERSGLFVFQLSDRTVQVHFKKGSPDFVDSSHAEDAVGDYLVKQGALSAAQLAQAEQEKARFGGETLGALFGLGLVNPGAAFAVLAQRAHSILLKVLLDESGSFTFSAQELPSHKVLPLGNRWAVLMELVRRVPQTEMRRRLHEALDLPVMKSGGSVAVADLRLTPQEMRALGFIDGVRSLNQLAHDLPQDAPNLFRLAFALKELELVSFAAVKLRPPPVAEPPPAPAASAAPPPPQAAKPPPGAAPKPPPQAPRAGPGARPPPPVMKPGSPAPQPGAPAPAAAPTAAAAPAAPSLSPEAELAELRARGEALKKQNHFEVLELTDKADAGAVKAAYFKLAKRFHPDTVAPNAPPELGKLKADIFAAIGEAYRTLGDDKSRAEYIENLKTGGGEQVDIAQILLAEETFQKACILVKARKFADAVKMLDEAIKGNPEEPEFFAWRGYAKFFSAPTPDKAPPDALKDIEHAIKKNERCAPAHFFLGQIAKRTGKTADAQKHFKKTVELQPDHIDAQRELRLLAKK